MTLRRLAIALLVLAAGLYVGVTRPARDERARLRADYRRVRDERHAARERLRTLERRARVRASARTGYSAAAGTDAVRELRRSLLSSLSAAPISAIRLAVHSGKAPLAATATLSGRGSYRDVFRLCGDLVRPGGGLVVRSVGLSESAQAVALELEGFRLAVTP